VQRVHQIERGLAALQTLGRQPVDLLGPAQHVALFLAIRARNLSAKYPIPDFNHRLIWECLEAIAFLLDANVSNIWLEAHRQQILAHYKE
jgi:hypothetical protein